MTADKKHDVAKCPQCQAEMKVEKKAFDPTKDESVWFGTCYNCLLDFEGKTRESLKVAKKK